MIAEFEDDARAVATTEPEFVPVNGVPLPAGFVSAWANSQSAVFPPFTEATTAARASWLRIVQRFTEPVPENESRLRVRGSEGSRSPSIWVGLRGSVNGERASAHAGTEVDVTDKQFLLLFSKVDSDNHEPCCRTTAIPWTEISSIQFEPSR